MKIKFDHFSFLAPLYEHFILPRNPKEIIAFSNLTGTETVLDAGGGTGRVAQFMTDKVKKILVADQSYKMLQEAQAKVELWEVCSETEDIPLANNTFDRIIMVDALHHVENKGKTTLELWRVLKPGGRIIIEEPNIRAFGVKLIAIAEKLFLMRSHFSSPQQIAEMFQFPNAKVKVEVEGSTSWIIVKKETNKIENKVN